MGRGYNVERDGRHAYESGGSCGVEGRHVTQIVESKEREIRRCQDTLRASVLASCCVDSCAYEQAGNIAG